MGTRTAPPPAAAAGVRAARWLAAPAAAAVVVAGVWVAGGLVTDSYQGSMALTALWYVAALAACAALGRRVRALLVPLLAGYLLAAGAVGAYLGYSTLHERVVDERVAVGVPAGATGAGEPPARRNVELASGRFRSGEHETRGTATLVRLAGGRRVVTLTGFSTAPGPDLRLRLVPGRVSDGRADGTIDLGALKGNRGDQQYELPDGARGSRWTVVIWCRAFSALFGAAPLRAP